MIQGVVVHPDGKPIYASIQFRVEGYSRDSAEHAESSKKGRFTFEALKGLRYLVRAVGSPEGGSRWHCHQFPLSDSHSALRIILDRPGFDCDECRERR
jgi:hypothetical protein